MEVSGLALHPGYFTPGGKEPQAPIEWEAGWALEPVLISGEENIFCVWCELNQGSSSPYLSHCTNYFGPPPLMEYT